VAPIPAVAFIIDTESISATTLHRRERVSALARQIDAIRCSSANDFTERRPAVQPELGARERVPAR
jgi:hypothetical protein